MLYIMAVYIDVNRQLKRSHALLQLLRCILAHQLRQIYFLCSLLSYCFVVHIRVLTGICCTYCCNVLTKLMIILTRVAQIQSSQMYVSVVI